MRGRPLLISFLAVALLAAACGDDGGGDTTTTAAPADTTTTGPAPTSPTTSDTTVPAPSAGDVVASGMGRIASDAPAEDLLAVAAGNREFAADLFAELADSHGNLVFSPASIRLALAMAYAGAVGDTAAEMADVLHLPFGGDRLHAAMNALDAAIESRNREEPPGPDDVERKVIVTIANALWGQEGFSFLVPFLDTLARNYGAGMRIVDFAGAAEAARQAINGWIADETNDRIKDLIPEGVLGPMVRLVLTNAVYLDATWMVPFDPNATVDGTFSRLDGSQVTVPIMHQEEMLPYAAGDGWQAVELPYVGEELAMLILVPDAGNYAEVEQRVADAVDEARRALGITTVRLGLPSFEFRTQAGLGDVLRRLGMETAFDPATANFTGMTAEERLFISDVIHEAFIAVDEAGTEAAAATAIVMRATAAPPDAVTLEIDRPFLFSLYDRETGAVLFMGRVLDPSS